MQKCSFDLLLFVEQQLKKNSRTHPIILSTEMADDLIDILRAVRCMEGVLAEEAFYKTKRGQA